MSSPQKRGREETGPTSRRSFLKAAGAVPFLSLTAGFRREPPGSALADEGDTGLDQASDIVIDHACPLVWAGMDEEYLEKTIAGGTTVAMSTVASNHNFREAVDLIGDWYERIERDSDKLLLVTTIDDLYRAKGEGKLGIGFHFQNSRPVGHDLGLLRIFRRLGVRVIQLTYNEKNLVGDGCTEITDSGLSKYGVQMVEEMNRVGITVDLSHVGHRTSMDAINVSSKPVLFSHSNAWAVHPSKRNIKDDQIQALARREGVIGINAFPGFVKQRDPTLADLLDHVDHIANVVGTEHIGIGLDFTTTTLEEYKRWGYSPDVYPLPPWVYPAGIDDPSKIPNFARGLQERGYADEEVRGILGGNFLRVFKQTWT